MILCQQDAARQPRPWLSWCKIDGVSIDQSAVKKAAVAAKTALVYASVVALLYPIAALGRVCDRAVERSLAWAKR